MPFVLDTFLPYRLSVASENVSRRFARRYGRAAGLSIPEWRVIAHLGAETAASVRDITKMVNLDKSVVSRAASRLEQRGLIRKSAHESDMRLVSIELTPEGQALMQKLERIAEEFQAELRAELGPEGEALGRALTRLSSSSDTD